MRIFRAMLILALTTLPFTAAAQGLDMTKLTDEGRLILRSEIRAYLLDNPEVLIEAMSVYDQRQRARDDQADLQMLSDNAEEIYTDGVSYVGGNPDGDLTMVEFMDYRCGYCRKAHEGVKKLVKDDGNIRLVIKEFPILGPDSLASSKIAIATLQLFGNKAYGALYDKLITFNGPINNVTARRILESVNIDADAVLDRMDSDKVVDHITRIHALGQKLDITGTPTFVIGNQIVRGYVPPDAMAKIAEFARSVTN